MHGSAEDRKSHGVVQKISRNSSTQDESEHRRRDGIRKTKRGENVTCSPVDDTDRLDVDGSPVVFGGKRRRKWLSTTEPLFMLTDEKYSMFPIKYPSMWAMYKKAVATFWTTEEVDLTMDMRDWIALSDNEQHFIKMVLALFAASDGMVMENLAVRFLEDVQVPEARAFFGFQIAIENIHSEMYSLLLDHFIRDSEQYRHLSAAIQTIPCVEKKAEWAKKWIHETSGGSFAERLVAFACVEGVHCSGSSCAISWLRKRGLMPGLTFSNELISRDEGLHADFACLLYGLLNRKLEEEVVHRIVDEAVRLEQEFCSEALSVELVGINASLMAKYIELVADRLLVALGCCKLYNAKNPFDWMEMTSLQGKTKCIEKRASHHQPNAGMDGDDFERKNNPIFTTDADF